MAFTKSGDVCLGQLLVSNVNKYIIIIVGYSYYLPRAGPTVNSSAMNSQITIVHCYYIIPNILRYYLCNNIIPCRYRKFEIFPRDVTENPVFGTNVFDLHNNTSVTAN